MISYKLAKQLKEAGYPIHDVWDESMYNGEPTEKDFKYQWDKISRNVSPTLSELIEECEKVIPDKIWTLQINPYWGSNPDDALYYVIKEYKIVGKTPEEAVAKLWLKLNNK